MMQSRHKEESKTKNRLLKALVVFWGCFGAGNTSFVAQSKSCGQEGSRDSFRILNPTWSRRCNFPWMVNLNVSGGLCSGSLISDQYVLTAGHCLKWKNQTLAAAENVTVHYGSNIQFDHHHSVKAAQLFLHPGYAEVGEYGRGYGSSNDVGIIKLKSKVQLDSCTNFVCLPKAGQETPTDNCKVMGWGNNKDDGSNAGYLMYTRDKPSDSDVCFGKNIRIFDFSNAAFCGTFNDTFCHGDSGGPLVCEDNDGHWTVFGIVSGKQRVCSKHTGVYYNVSSYVAWIEHITHIKQSKWNEILIP